MGLIAGAIPESPLPKGTSIYNMRDDPSLLQPCQFENLKNIKKLPKIFSGVANIGKKTCLIWQFGPKLPNKAKGISIEFWENGETPLFGPQAPESLGPNDNLSSKK
ncbi:MAG: hypothetical protein EHM27_04530 [Deltaproteobacteria bacterium]|nr:MAG: hypothetical protein EHM27_04530 [Deltaproteobacteria bacterium]